MAFKKSSAQQIKHEYFMWLCRHIRAIGSGESYYCLMNALDKISFRWSIRLDENRARDGKGLRIQFEQQCNYICDDMDVVHEVLNRYRCSVLEMLVALADRMSDQVGCQPYIWFWELIENLNLSGFTDNMFVGEGGTEKVNQVVDIFMDREFDPDGTGSPFPISDPSQDQRNVEIWYQMQAYLMENYDV